MALHNRDYMGGAAPPPGSTSESPSWLRGYRLLILLCVLVFLAWQAKTLAPVIATHFVCSREALAQGRVWTLLTASLFHADLVHMLTTLLFVWWCGREIEERYGGLTVIGIFFLGGMAAGLASAVIYPGGEQSPVPALPGGGSSGTGFYVSDQLIVTNAHVVDDADEVALEVGPGKRRATGEVIARDKELDLALIKTEQRGVPLALRSQVNLGKSVFALGYGVVSGRNADLLVTRGTISAHQAAEQKILFDATVNPGNSGGPLVDVEGRWLGVVVAKSRAGDGVDSLGYAIDGEAAARWLANKGCTVRREAGEPKGDAPPPATLESVVRIAVGGVAPVLRDMQWMRFGIDPRVFGASGGVWALACFVLFRWPKREVSVFGQAIPLLVLFIFFGMSDVMAALRVHGGGLGGLSNAYHAAGGAIGFALHKLGFERLTGRIRRRFRLWWRNTRQAPPPTIPFPSRASEPEEPSGGSDKLDRATRERMDEILAKVSQVGIHGLSDEERAFLEEASNKLRGGD
ncbi:MAG TPA: hypothetical protein DEA08_17335 [Planctomycetes bacterium]|nr:hypothetical protein [Planctomycetota bacterium]